MDAIKSKIDEIVSKIKGDKHLGEKFAKDPIKTVEGLLGVDLPDEAVKNIVEGVKDKLGGGDGKKGIGDLLGGLKDKFGK